MSCTATTMERIANYVSAGTGNMEVPATTEASVRRRNFRLSDALFIEIEFEGDEPHWLVDWMEQLSEVLSLEQDWDSYAARKIKPSAVLGVLNFFLPNMQDVAGPLPAIVPDKNGNVQLEWHIRNADLEVVALAEHRYSIFYERNGDVILDDLITTNPAPALEALREISVLS